MSVGGRCEVAVTARTRFGWLNLRDVVNYYVEEGLI